MTANKMPCRDVIRLVALLSMGAIFTASGAFAQEAPAPAAPSPPSAASADEELSQVEARLADRFDRLELLVGRLAELSR
jgi:hypothetical protein